MIDQDNHIIDPVSGFAKHAETGHIIGLEQAHPLATRRDTDWPKWVPVHESHIVRRKVDGAPDVISTPGWENSHVNRADGTVTVLVANEDVEKRASGEYVEAEAVPAVDEATRRQVEADVARAQRERAQALADAAAKENAALVAAEVARRVAEKVEQEARERAAAADLAKTQDERLNAVVPPVPPVPPVPERVVSAKP